MPLTSVVLPAPRSPVSTTSIGAESRPAKSRPAWMVSPAEDVRYCLVISVEVFPAAILPIRSAAATPGMLRKYTLEDLLRAVRVPLCEPRRCRRLNRAGVRLRKPHQPYAMGTAPESPRGFR